MYICTHSVTDLRSLVKCMPDDCVTIKLSRIP